MVQRMWKIGLLIPLFIIAALAAPHASFGDAKNFYYGYNNLSPTYPMAGCFSEWGAGCASSGYNNWDWSGIDKVSGGCITIGHLGGSPPTSDFYYISHYCSDWNGTTFHVTRSGVGAPLYNRAFCAYWDGSTSYARCWAQICPCGSAIENDVGTSNFAGASWSGSRLRLARMSNTGTETTLFSPTQASELRGSDIGLSVSSLGERNGVSFYTAVSDRGQPCFLTSRAEAPRAEFSTVACLGEAASLVPSRARPLVDFSAFRQTAGETLPKVSWLTGFAADEVSSVGVIDQSGGVHAVSVRDNIYASRDVPGLRVTALVAYSASGTEIYRQSLAGLHLADTAGSR